MRARVRRVIHTWSISRQQALRCIRILAAAILLLSPGLAAAQDIVLYSNNVQTVRGNWALAASSSGAGGQRMASADQGWSSLNNPHSNPTNYFEATFDAQAWVQYRIWVRARATGDSKWNDSVWLQFTDSLDSSGNAVYRTGTAQAMLINLEACNGCGEGSWGWSGGAWWVSQPVSVQFPSTGSRSIRVQTREDGIDIDQIVLSSSTYLHSAPGSTTYDATIVPKSGGGGDSGGMAPPPPPPSTAAKPLPGTVEAEDFDEGGQGVGYYDHSPGNNGGAYRQTDVDIAASDGRYTVGWAGAGEWLRYTVNVAASGTYKVTARVASAGNGGSFHIEFNGVDKTGSMQVPNTGDWNSHHEVSTIVDLSAGVQSMRIVLDTNGGTGAVGNFSAVRVEAASAPAPSPSPIPPPSGSSPYSGSPAPIPGTIQSEDFDIGSNGTAYFDHSPGNVGGAYRPNVDVDISPTGSGGYTIGWAGAGEWLNYTVNVASAGQYTVTVRVASATSGGTFHLEFNGTDKTGSLSVPHTGGWDSWQDVTVGVSLAAGVQTMRLVLDTNGGSGAVGNFSYVRVTEGAVSTPPPTTTGNIVRVMTWNIKFGGGDPWGQAQLIANSGADVVLLQEASTWDEDMPTTYPARLRQITGQNWQAVWGPSVNCAGGCQGSMILTRLPIVNSEFTYQYESTPTRVRHNFGGVNVDFFNVHLTYDNRDMRTTQLLNFMNWTRNFGGPHISGGDFNSWWDEWWIHQMETEYTDTWRDVTGGIDGGFTLNNAVRFDYLFRFRQNNWRLTPTGAWVIPTHLSDHYPLVAEYRVQ